jgi:hypothetical protein
VEPELGMLVMLVREVEGRLFCHCPDIGGGSILGQICVTLFMTGPSDLCNH